MRFVETPVFTKRVKDLLPDEDYRTLQIALLLRPEQGPLIKGGGGLRKVRWALKGVGKRGGVRVIYGGRGPGLYPGVHFRRTRPLI